MKILLLLFLVIGIIVDIASALPAPGDHVRKEKHNCLYLDAYKEEQINMVVEKLTEFLNELADEMGDLDLTVLNLEIDQHFDDEEEENDTILQLTVNNCVRFTHERGNSYNQTQAEATNSTKNKNSTIVDQTVVNSNATSTIQETTLTKNNTISDKNGDLNPGKADTTTISPDIDRNNEDTSETDDKEVTTSAKNSIQNNTTELEKSVSNTEKPDEITQKYNIDDKTVTTEASQKNDIKTPETSTNVTELQIPDTTTSQYEPHETNSTSTTEKSLSSTASGEQYTQDNVDDAVENDDSQIEEDENDDSKTDEDISNITNEDDHGLSYSESQNEEVNEHKINNPNHNVDLHTRSEVPVRNASDIHENVSNQNITTQRDTETTTSVTTYNTTQKLDSENKPINDTNLDSTNDNNKNNLNHKADLQTTSNGPVRNANDINENVSNESITTEKDTKNTTSTTTYNTTTELNSENKPIDDSNLDNVNDKNTNDLYLNGYLQTTSEMPVRNASDIHKNISNQNITTESDTENTTSVTTNNETTELGDESKLINDTNLDRSNDSSSPKTSNEESFQNTETNKTQMEESSSTNPNVASDDYDDKNNPVRTESGSLSAYQETNEESSANSDETCDTATPEVIVFNLSEKAESLRNALNKTDTPFVVYINNSDENHTVSPDEVNSTQETESNTPMVFELQLPDIGKIINDSDTETPLVVFVQDLIDTHQRNIIIF